MFEWIALLLFLFPLAYSPGPGNMFFAALAAHSGARAIGPALVGYHVATLLVTILIGIGLLQSLHAFPTFAKVIGVLGSLYVFYLAIRFIKAPAIKMTADAQHARTAGFTDGAVLLLLNPKAYLIIVLMFTQFAPSELVPSAPLIGALAIAVVFTANNLVAFLFWSQMGDLLMRRFRGGPQQKVINQGFGLLMAAIAIWMLWANFQQ
jgi:threonine/homoserine/homoserine lactone efflux protein